MPIAGKVMPRPMGDYDPATIYGVLDIVNHDERPWICKKDNTQNVEPTVLNTDNWQMLFDVDVTNADTLDGFDSSYFASNQRLSTITMVTFLASDWVGEAAPFTQTVTVDNISETDTPIPLFVDDGTTETDSKAKKKAYGFITHFDSANGTVTATCNYKKPTVDFCVGLKGV